MNKPFCVSGACLRLAEESYYRLRDQLILELTTEHINQRFARNATFQKQLQSNIPRIEQDRDVAELFHSARNITAYIAVPGPTLGEHYDCLRNKPAGNLLIAVDAALKPLMMQGITPDIVVSIDGNRDTILRCYDVDLGLLKHSRLVYFPVVHPDVLGLWPGERYAAYSSSPIYEELRGRIVRGLLYASGSVLHPAVDLAVNMGCTRIELLGADFGFPDDQAYVAGSTVASAYSVKDRAETLVKDGYGRDIRTTRQFRGYQLDLEAYIEAHPEVSFINGSKRGAHILGTMPLQSSS